ncbi:MAG: TylF/MycF family methyltransferase [Actinomycetota bacterium]|nr:TylF/MycF family methyltransferase [Actinomycetota bacterium]
MVRLHASRHEIEIGPISVLRIDGDWYESVKTCLVELYDQVSRGGFVIFDDYFVWEGCAVAVHEFLGERKLGHRLITNETAHFRKR